MFQKGQNFFIRKLENVSDKLLFEDISEKPFENVRTTSE